MTTEARFFHPHIPHRVLHNEMLSRQRPGRFRPGDVSAPDGQSSGTAGERINSAVRVSALQVLDQLEAAQEEAGNFGRPDSPAAGPEPAAPR